MIISLQFDKPILSPSAPVVPCLKKRPESPTMVPQFFLRKVHSQRGITLKKIIEPPKRSVLEEVGNSVTHGVGALLGIAGAVLLLLKARGGVQIFSAAVYGACMIVMFLMSCLYHAFRWGSRVKRLWRRFDYISIYLLIGGTFTPLWLVLWGNQAGIILCCVQWAVIVTGVTLVGVFGPGRPKWLHMTLFIVLGWSGLVFLPGLLRASVPLLLFILGGGLVYTLGIIPFALKRKGAHFLWHFFVLFGAVIHWFGLYLYVFGA